MNRFILLLDLHMTEIDFGQEIERHVRFPLAVTHTSTFSFLAACRRVVIVAGRRDGVDVTHRLLLGLLLLLFLSSPNFEFQPLEVSRR